MFTFNGNSLSKLCMFVTEPRVRFKLLTSVNEVLATIPMATNILGSLLAYFWNN